MLHGEEGVSDQAENTSNTATIVATSFQIQRVFYSGKAVDACVEEVATAAYQETRNPISPIS